MVFKGKKSKQKATSCLPHVLMHAGVGEFLPSIQFPRRWIQLTTWINKMIDEEVSLSCLFLLATVWEHLGLKAQALVARLPLNIRLVGLTAGMPSPPRQKKTIQCHIMFKHTNTARNWTKGLHQLVALFWHSKYMLISQQGFIPSIRIFFIHPLSTLLVWY